MSEQTKRYMLNTKTGVLFNFDAAQVADDRKPFMMECDKDGNITHPNQTGPSREQILTREVAELKAKLNERGGVTEEVTILQATVDSLTAENVALAERVEELEAALDSQVEPAPVEAAPASDCPESFTADQHEEMKVEARKLGVTGGIGNMKPETLWAKIQAAKAEAAE